MRAGEPLGLPCDATAIDKLSHRGCETVPGTTLKVQRAFGSRRALRVHALRIYTDIRVYGPLLIFVTYDLPTLLQRIALQNDARLHLPAYPSQKDAPRPLFQPSSRRIMKKYRQTRRRMVLFLLSYKVMADLKRRSAERLSSPSIHRKPEECKSLFAHKASAKLPCRCCCYVSDIQLHP